MPFLSSWHQCFYNSQVVHRSHAIHALWLKNYSAFTIKPFCIGWLSLHKIINCSHPSTAKKLLVQKGNVIQGTNKIVRSLGLELSITYIDFKLFLWEQFQRFPWRLRSEHSSRDPGGCLSSCLPCPTSTSADMSLVWIKTRKIRKKLAKLGDAIAISNLKLTMADPLTGVGVRRRYYCV